MRSNLLLTFVATITLAGCSSSSEPGPSSDASNTDTAVVDTGKDTATTAKDTAVDDTTASDDTEGTDTPTPPPDKCAGKTCSGAYMACCATTGACYDTRCASCCY
jgi:hypothetical protein